MRVLDGMPGKEVAAALGTSEPTVSRRLAKVRAALRLRVEEVVQTYSFTKEELEEAARNGLLADPNTNAAGDALFDEAVADIHRAETTPRV